MSKLIDYCIQVTDGEHGTVIDDNAGKFYLLSSKNIGDNVIEITSQDRKINKDTFECLINKTKLSVGDVVISSVGTLGKTCVIEEKPNFVFQRSVGIIKPNPKLLNSYYLKYQLDLPSFQKRLSFLANGGLQKGLYIGDLEKLDIKCPDLIEQNKIVEILKSFDDKIKNNNKINAELESMAKTLYDYWFLQFEFPNEEGKPYKSSGGKMVYNEELKREIPEGWEVKNLMSNPLCKDIKAGVDYFKSKNYLPTANIEGEQITDGDNVTYESRENRANMQPSKNSVWFAKMKNSIKHLSIPNNSEWFINKYILSTGFQGLQCTEESFAYIHCFINQKWFEIYKDVLSHGATQEGVNNEDLKSVLMVIPPRDILIKFSKMITPSLEDKFSKIKENQELSLLRDFLLPLLMNGQVTIQ